MLEGKHQVKMKVGMDIERNVNCCYALRGEWHGDSLKVGCWKACNRPG